MLIAYQIRRPHTRLQRDGAAGHNLVTVNDLYGFTHPDGDGRVGFAKLHLGVRESLGLEAIYGLLNGGPGKFFYHAGAQPGLQLSHRVEGEYLFDSLGMQLAESWVKKLAGCVANKPVPFRLVSGQLVALRGALFKAFAAEFPKRRHGGYQVVVLGNAVQGNGGGRPIRQLVMVSNARKVTPGRIGVKPFVPAGKLGVGQFPHDTTRGQGINEINAHASTVKRQCHPCQAGACRRYDVDKLLAMW